MIATVAGLQAHTWMVRLCLRVPPNDHQLVWGQVELYHNDLQHRGDMRLQLREGLQYDRYSMLQKARLLQLLRCHQS